MRLNKKKLAALAMSAVMAASTMPFPVLAEEFTDGSGNEATVAETYGVPATSAIDWSYDEETGKGYATYVDDKGSTVTREVTVVKVTEATCDEDGYAYLEWDMDGNGKCEGRELGQVLVQSQKGHLWKGKIEYVQTKAPTCSEKGYKEAYEICENDSTHKRRKPELDVIIPAQHTFEGEEKISYEVNPNIDHNIKLDKDGNVIVGENGLPQVVDPTKRAFYDRVTKQYCKDCEQFVEKSRTQESIKPEEVKFYYIYSTDNIDDTRAGLGKKLTYDDFEKLKADAEKGNVDLIDCTKDGKIVAYATSKPVEKLPVLSEETMAQYATINVKQHHKIVKTIEVAKADKGFISASIDANGNAVVKNNSCYKDVAYYVVEYCVNESKCDLDVKGPDYRKYDVTCKENLSAYAHVREYKRTKMIAEPEGNHSIEEALKAELLSKKENSEFVNSKGELTLAGRASLDYLKGKYAANRYVKFSDDTATCTESGTIVVTFICKQCEKEIDTITFKTPKLGHEFRIMADEKTRVPSTCEHRGHYETAKLCTRCGVEAEDSERVTVYTKRLPHTNEYSVSDSGVGRLTDDGKYIDKDAEVKFVGDKVIDINGENLAAFASGNKKYIKSVIVGSSVSAGVYTNCTVCHNNEVKIGDINSITITGIQKENASGAAGKITLKATYTIKDTGKTVTNEVTVPYFSSALAYAGRTEDEVLNGLHEDKDGVTRYYVDNKVSEVTGIITYAGREYLVNKGVLCEDTHGVTLVGDTFYFLANGCVQRGFTGVTIYDGQSFYLNNGEVDTEINGLVPYNGGTFLFAAGRLVKEHNGLWQDFDGSWYFLALGQVQTQYTGVAEYDGACFYVKNGKLDTTKNGTITIDGVKYTAVDGQLYK